MWMHHVATLMIVVRSRVEGKTFDMNGELAKGSELDACLGLAQEQIVNLGLKGLVFDAMIRD